MKMNIKSIKSKITKKRLIWIAVTAVVLVLGYLLFFNKKSTEELLTVKRADFLQQVSASGKIIPRDNLNLSFSDSGRVSSVSVKVGDMVRTGQLLASQNTGELGAQYIQMQAGVDLQKAKLAQLLDGASPEDAKTTEDAVIAAEQNLKNAYFESLNNLSGAYTALFDAFIAAQGVRNDHFDPSETEMYLAVDAIENDADAAKNYLALAESGDNNQKDISIARVITFLNTAYRHLGAIRQKFEEPNYYGMVSSTNIASIDAEKASINAIQASVISDQSSINSYKAALQQAKSALALKKAPVRESDIAVYQAQVKQAEGSLQSVVAQLNKKRIYSPIDGLVTAVNAKVGSVFGSQEAAVSVISQGAFQVESFVPEINISFIKVGQEAEVTLDAYGSQAVFPVRVVSIDPAETIKDGVSTYKVTLQFPENDERVKSGMTGNVIVTTDKKFDVISIPQGLVKVKGGKRFVSVKEGEETVEKEVQTGAIASNGNIEITSGLEVGQLVIVKP